MTTSTRSLTGFLLPIDTMEASMNAIHLAGLMAAALPGRLKKISLLHVVSGSYFSRHMKNIDFRVDYILQSEQIRNLKKQHIAQKIEPELKKVEETLRASGTQVPIDLAVKDGDPAGQILNLAATGDFSTIIMERRGRSELRDVTLGSISTSLLHSKVKSSIYLVGDKQANSGYPLSKSLIAIDGSEHSDKALHEAAELLAGFNDPIEEVVLLHVIDVLQNEAQSNTAGSPKDMAHSLLAKAAKVLIAKGIDAHKIKKVVGYGHPVDTLVAEISQRDSAMIFMGRRGRTGLQELFMGSVTRGVIYRCPKPTIALILAGRP